MANKGPGVYYLVNARMRTLRLGVWKCTANFAKHVDVDDTCFMHVSSQDNVVTEGKSKDFFQKAEQTFEGQKKH